jgi:hypothetical protein
MLGTNDGVLPATPNGSSILGSVPNAISYVDDYYPDYYTDPVKT